MEIAEYSEFKRCLEVYMADPEFRTLMERDPDRAVETLGFEKEVEGYPARDAIHWLLFHTGVRSVCAGNPYINEYIRFVEKACSNAEIFHTEESIPSVQMYGFLKQEKERCFRECSLLQESENIYYFPMALELSDGCSIQCPFCGFGAPRFQGYAAYSQENAAIVQLRKILALYSPEELAYVELLLHNRRSVNRYSASGRASVDGRYPESKKAPDSISCISGLKINLVRKSIEFVRPQLPSAEYPYGYSVSESCLYADPADLKKKMEHLIQNHIFKVE